MSTVEWAHGAQRMWESHKVTVAEARTEACDQHREFGSCKATALLAVERSTRSTYQDASRVSWETRRCVSNRVTALDQLPSHVHDALGNLLFQPGQLTPTVAQGRRSIEDGQTSARRASWSPTTLP